MRHLSVFNNVSVDGFFTDANNDMSWAHAGADDPEWLEFTRGNVRGGSELLFGRKTYDMMATAWSTPEAMKRAPEVAERMKHSPKVVFSHGCDPLWSNTRCVTGDPAAEVRKMKELPGDTEPMTILGSGTIVSQLAQAGLIDTVTLVVVPVIVGKGRTLFEGVDRRIVLKPTSTRSFANGRVVTTYEVGGAA